MSVKDIEDLIYVYGKSSDENMRRAAELAKARPGPSPAIPTRIIAERMAETMGIELGCGITINVDGSMTISNGVARRLVDLAEHAEKREGS